MKSVIRCGMCKSEFNPWRAAERANMSTEPCPECGRRTTENKRCVICSKRVFTVADIALLCNIKDGQISVPQLIDHTTTSFGTHLIRAYRKNSGCPCLTEQYRRFGLGKNLPIPMPKFDKIAALKFIKTKLRVREENVFSMSRRKKYLNVCEEIDAWVIDEHDREIGTVIMVPPQLTDDDKLHTRYRVGIHHFMFHYKNPNHQLYVLECMPNDKYELTRHSSDYALECWNELIPSLEILTRTIGFMYDNPSHDQTIVSVRGFLTERGYIVDCEHTHEKDDFSSEDEDNSDSDV